MNPPGPHNIVGFNVDRYEFHKLREIARRMREEIRERKRFSFRYRYLSKKLSSRNMHLGESRRSDINSLAPVTSGVACPNLSENRSRGNNGRDMKGKAGGGGTSWLCLVGGINHRSI